MRSTGCNALRVGSQQRQGDYVDEIDEGAWWAIDDGVEAAIAAMQDTISSLLLDASKEAAQRELFEGAQQEIVNQEAAEMRKLEVRVADLEREPCSQHCEFDRDCKRCVVHSRFWTKEARSVDRQARL